MSPRLALILPLLAAATGASSEWHFDPSVGVGGEAYVTNERVRRLAVECAPDGSPSVSLSPDPRLASSGAGVQNATFHVMFDENDPVELSAQCHRAGERSVCVAQPGLWTSWQLLDALRGRSQISIAYEGGVETWSLVGSRRAIQRLDGCLLP